jgi:hypothetical protein
MRLMGAYHNELDEYCGFREDHPGGDRQDGRKSGFRQQPLSS